MVLKGKKGFTLIEMTVVMGMIAILALISVIALLSSRNQTMLDSMTQDVLSNIREAQNRSVSTVSSSNTYPAKAWAYQIDTSRNNSLYSYTEPGHIALLPPVQEGTNTVINPSATVSINKIASDGTTVTPFGAGTIANIAFTSPFGKPYITDGSCAWQAPGTRPAQDWYIDPTCGNLISPSSTTNPGFSLKITITYKNLSKDIIVGANGDSYIQ